MFFLFAENGKVGFTNFVEFLSSHSDQEKEEAYILESFRSFDVDNTGSISSQDIREILMGVMEKSPTQDKNQILKVFNLEKERQVSYQGEN